MENGRENSPKVLFASYQGVYDLRPRFQLNCAQKYVVNQNKAHLNILCYRASLESFPIERNTKSYLDKEEFKQIQQCLSKFLIHRKTEIINVIQNAQYHKNKYSSKQENCFYFQSRIQPHKVTFQIKLGKGYCELNKQLLMATGDCRTRAGSISSRRLVM